jgi:RNA polymerase sigma factor (TIGR02999 family)
MSSRTTDTPIRDGARKTNSPPCGTDSMMNTMLDQQQTTLLLRRAAGGDAGAADELLPLVYDELRELAGRYMAAERAQHTLQPTALINEAWLRMLGERTTGEQTPAWQNRAHFVGLAARAMRQVLIDHARRRDACKRGGGEQRLPLDAALDVYSESGPDLLVLEEALSKLETLDPQLVRIVELRFFAGADNQDAAAALGVSTRTIERGWKTAQAWLRAELGGEEARKP